VAVVVSHVHKNRKKVTREFKSGGLHERHVVATWKLGYHLSIRLCTQGDQEKTCIEGAGRKTFRILTLASSPASKVRTAVHT
jgi:hypothetical protein